jgi:penicillin-binding protein 1A
MQFLFNLYFQLIDRIFGTGTIAKFSSVVLILLGFNVLALVATYKDLKLLQNAGEYEIPSVLYGVDPDQDYAFVPVAEFYQFSKQIIHLDPEKDTYLESKVVQAFLSSEDSDFYKHFGVDFRGIARAFVVNIIAGRIKEGASTITQQVARLKFLNTDRSFVRKAREAWLAVLMEFKFSKRQILEMYLNEIPLGHGTLGVGAASKFYFRKSWDELSWGEAALLASLTTRPKEFSPLVNPNLSSSKVRVSFMKLIENGRIDVETAEKEYRAFFEFYQNLNRSPNASAYSDRLNRFPYFTEHVRRQLLKKFKADELYNGGLKVYSTLNIHHQMAAEETLAEALEKQTKASNQRAFKDIDVFDDNYGPVFELLADLHDLADFKFKISREERTFVRSYQEEYRDNISMLNYLVGTDLVGDIYDKNYSTQSTQDHLLPVEGSIISIRPDNGYITAIVGGSGFRSDNQQIRSFQAFRQAGSSFKPLVYATAIDYSGKNPKPTGNITAASQFLDSPLNFILEQGDEWSPENYSADYSGFIRLRSALETSKNSVAVRVVEEMGLAHLIPPLTELLQPGNREIPKNYSVALGTFDVTPYEMAKAYAIIANKGKDLIPTSIQYVTTEDGKMLHDYREEIAKKEMKQILSPEASFIITSMMQDVIKKGTGKSVLAQGLTRPAAGKTGTTNNFRDAWFVGYTPELVASVWMGYDLGTLSLGKGMAGGVISAPIWGKFMVKSLRKEKPKNFDFGELNLLKTKVCKLSGKAPGSSCRETVEEYFIPETFDKTPCDDHRSKGLDPILLELPEFLKGNSSQTKTSKSNKKKKK